MNRGIQEGPQHLSTTPIGIIKTLFVAAMFVAALAMGVWAYAGIDDGPDPYGLGGMVAGGLVVYVTPDGVMVQTPHDFCSDFPTAPCCRPGAACNPATPTPAPTPQPTPMPGTQGPKMGQPGFVYPIVGQ